MSVVSETVKRIVIEKLGLLDGVYKRRLPFEVLEMGWVDRFELIEAIEAEFRVHIPLDDIEKLTTPSKLIKFLEEER
jgi:acyl carrier protein